MPCTGHDIRSGARIEHTVQIGKDSCTAARCAQENSGGANHSLVDERDTFDRPSVPTSETSMPPALDPSCVFDVVLGCEVLYETPHAQWVAAAIKLRLKQQGHAWIAGAVRDSKVRPHQCFPQSLAVYEAPVQ